VEPQSRSGGFTSEKSLVPAGKRAQIPRSFTVYPSQYTDRAVPAPTKRYKFPKITLWLRSSRVIYTLPAVINSLSVASVFTGSDLSGALLSKARCKVYILSDGTVEIGACVKVGDMDS